MQGFTDVLISGGGVAGLLAAAAFGTAGFDVVCVEPNPPITTADMAGADLRSTAFLQPSVRVLDAAGIWDRLAPFAAPLQIMRIIDAGGASPEPRIIKDFDAKDVSDLPFGWNVPNWLLRRESLARLAELPNVTFLPGVSTVSLVTRQAQAIIGLSTGDKLRAKLVIAADGRHSTMREAAGIAVTTLRYGQKALTFAVTHAAPHHNVSTEIHRTGGPFTLVPLPDREGKHCSAIVWMETGPEVMRLAQLPQDAFEAAMNLRSCGVMGPLTLASQRSTWPIISQIATRMSGQRIALMAEAAHVMPPIGAQGLNMSMADLDCLLQLAIDARHASGDTAHVSGDPPLGCAKMLDAYHNKRHFDVLARVLGIDALNRASMIGAPTLRDLRAGALSGLYAFTPLRKALMKAGLGLK
jgi:2-octaprenyl-6-methoxyphenol hydroxylase